MESIILLRRFIHKAAHARVSSKDIQNAYADLMKLELTFKDKTHPLIKSLKASKKRRMDALAEMSELCLDIAKALKDRNKK